MTTADDVRATFNAYALENAAQVTEFVEQLASKDARIDELEERIAVLEAGQPDPTPTGGVLYGSSNQTSKGTWSELIGHVGHDLQVHRIYDPSPETVTQSSMREDIGKRATAGSFKLGGASGFDAWPKAVAGSFDAAVVTRWNSVPLDHDLWDTPWHECDGGHDRQDGRSNDYLGMFSRFYNLLKPINRRRLSEGGVPIKLGPILMGETVANLDPTIWTPDELDFFGVDFYTQKTPPTPFKDRVGVYENYAEQLGVPLCIGETGCPQVDPNQGGSTATAAEKRANRVKWVRDMWTYLHTTPAEYGYVCYWNSSNNFMTTQPEWDALGSYS